MAENKDVEAWPFSVTPNKKTEGRTHKLKSRKILFNTRKGIIPVESLKSLGWKGSLKDHLVKLSAIGWDIFYLGYSFDQIAQGCKVNTVMGCLERL